MSNPSLFIFAMLLFTALFFGACHDKVSSPDAAFDKLYGKWHCVSYSGGISGTTTYLESTGNTIEFVFKRGGVFKEYFDGKLSSRYEFGLYEHNPYSIYGSEYAIRCQPVGLFSKNDPVYYYAVTFINDNAITLIQLECDDGIGYYFIK